MKTKLPLGEDHCFFWKQKEKKVKLNRLCPSWVLHKLLRFSPNFSQKNDLRQPTAWPRGIQRRSPRQNRFPHCCPKHLIFPWNIDKRKTPTMPDIYFCQQEIQPPVSICAKRIWEKFTSVHKNQSQESPFRNTSQLFCALHQISLVSFSYSLDTSEFPSPAFFFLTTFVKHKWAQALSLMQDSPRQGCKLPGVSVDQCPRRLSFPLTRSALCVLAQPKNFRKKKSANTKHRDGK